MNQNNNQVQQSSQVSQEELAKTQVLNLNDVKALAKFERKTSKKPAVLFAIAGILSISLGFAYPNIMTALDAAPANSKVEVKDDDTTILNKVQENEMVCKLVCEENPDGTSGTATYTLDFNDNDQLEGYTMVLTIDPLPGNASGLVATQNTYNAYKALDAIQITGYNISTSYTETGMKSVATVDLKTLNKATFPTTHGGFAAVPFTVGATKEAVEQYLTPTGYVCK